MSIDHMTVYASKLSVRIAELERENAALREALRQAQQGFQRLASPTRMIDGQASEELDGRMDYARGQSDRLLALSRAVPPTTESSEND